MENKDKFQDYPYKKDGHPVFFLHLTAWGKTLAMYAPLVNDLNYAVNELVDGAKREPGDAGPAGRVAIMVGVSALHPKDRYNRDIGRKVSMGKMKPAFAWVQRAMIDKKGILYTVEIPESKITVNLFAKHGDSRANILNGWADE